MHAVNEKTMKSSEEAVTEHAGLFQGGVKPTSFVSQRKRDLGQKRRGARSPCPAVTAQQTKLDCFLPTSVPWPGHSNPGWSGVTQPLVIFQDEDAMGVVITQADGRGRIFPDTHRIA